MNQAIVSTKENKLAQKHSSYNSSSTAFWAVINKTKQIDTVLSFLNHFLLKRGIRSVSMRLSIRDIEGRLLKEVVEEIKEPVVYSYSISNELEEIGIYFGEFSVFIEFTSENNLAVPFCAVTAEIISPTTLDVVHTYGRALEVQEIGSSIDFATSYETGWSIWSCCPNISNHLIFHNGRLHASVTFGISFFKHGRTYGITHLLKFDFIPFQTCRIDMEGLLSGTIEGRKTLAEIKNSKSGSFDAKIKVSGLKATFPRMLFACIKHSDNSNLVYDFDKINITHSNFDFDKASQPKSGCGYGFLNNPAYPKGVKSGFRYYPCSDLNTLTLGGKQVDSKPIVLGNLQSTQILSKNPIPSRLVGSNWSIWQDPDFVKDCSTGTFIVEYDQIGGHWHWGRLVPKGKNISAILSLFAPFSTAEESFNFEIRLFDQTGCVHFFTIAFKETCYQIEFSCKENFMSGSGIYYVIAGDGIGRFNVFSTFYFSDLSDGSIEHAF